MLRLSLLALLGTILAAVSTVAAAQSVELVGATQRFEGANAAGRIDEALAAGESAAHLLEAGGQPAGLAEMYRDLGDYAAESRREAAARRDYGRALELLQGLL